MADSVTDREKSIRAAKLAEQAERYDEMLEEMSIVAKMGEVLTVEDESDQEDDEKDDYMDVDDENVEDDEKDEDDENVEDDENDEDEDPAGGSELSRSEKKSRKAMLKLGMEPVTGVSLVTFKCSKKETSHRLCAICNPDVFKSTKTETYIIFGEVNYKPLRPVGETLCVQRFSQITLAEQDREDLEVDETGITFRDIVAVMTLTNASRTKAVEALRNHNGDVVNAAMELLKEIEMLEEMSKVAKMGEVLTVEEMSAIFESAMEDSHFDREKLVHKAEQAKKDGRYDDMIKEMNKLAIMVEKLTENERNLLSVAYENAVGPRMESWRKLSFEESSSDVRGINGDKLKLESEINKICGDILPIIEEHLIPTSSTPLDSLIYYKMKGDCSMYLAELKTGDDKDKYARQSLKAYKAAKSKGAETKLPRAHPYRLGLDLSFSSFFKVVKDWPECVCKMAKEALDEAEDEGNRLNDEKEKKESKNIFGKLLLLYSLSLYESQGKEIVVTGAQEASE